MHNQVLIELTSSLILAYAYIRINSVHTLKTIKYNSRKRSNLLTLPCECGINRALPVCVWIMKAVQGVDDGNGGGTGGGAACELEESKPLSAMYVLVVVELLSPQRSIELRVAVLI